MGFLFPLSESSQIKLNVLMMQPIEIKPTEIKKHKKRTQKDIHK